MLDEIFDFYGGQCDRSDIHMTFDGLDLAVTIEDRSDEGESLTITFETALKFEWELEGSMQNVPNEPSEKLLKQPAQEFLLERSENDHPFLNNKIHEYRILLTDLGYLKVFARSAVVKKGSLESPS